MAYAVITESGTAYEVRDGKVTRYQVDPVAWLREEWASGTSKRLMSVEDPVEGERWTFEFRGCSGERVSVTTSVVRMIAPIVSVSV